MLETHKIQRIKHLQLQGFKPEEASKMQGVSLDEVLKIYNDDKVFNKIDYSKESYAKTDDRY